MYAGKVVDIKRMTKKPKSKLLIFLFLWGGGEGMGRARQDMVGQDKRRSWQGSGSNYFYM